MKTVAAPREVLRVLLLEDNPADAELSLRELERSGFVVCADIVSTDVDFRTRLDAECHDVILSDFRLPDWTGMDALVAMRDRGLDLPFILVSGTLGDEAAVECVKQGVDDYVLKGHIGRLPMAVRRAREVRAAQQERARADRRDREREQALEESEARFRKLIEAAFDGVAIVVDGMLHDANRGVGEIFGYDVAEMIARPALRFVAPESKAVMEKHIRDNVEGRRTFIGLRKDGRKIQVEATAKVHVLDGRPGQLVALRDVTEQRHLELQLRQSQKMDAIGRLAGGVAHDFNNILTVITAYTSLLQESFAPSDPRRDDVSQIAKATRDAASLTRQMLAFSRQQVVEPTVVLLEEVVGRMGKMLRRLIGEDIDLITTMGPEPARVMMDPGQLEQILMNLAVNSRDAMPTGGQLTIETTTVDLDDDYRQRHWPATTGRFAMLAVSDTGHGMDSATQSRIFEPFFTTKELGKGTGLGLATVYGIVKQSNGFIWVYSEPGQGTTFKVYLPLVGEEGNVLESRDVMAFMPRGTETVLLTEDAAAVRAATRQMLERFGYTVLEAASGAEALEIAASHVGPISLLMTDVVMPTMSGRRLAEEFGARYPDSKVLYVSGYADDAVVRHGVLSGSVAFLQKPFSFEALARKVRATLDGP